VYACMYVCMYVCILYVCVCAGEENHQREPAAAADVC
jgi:hypothetical protein